MPPPVITEHIIRSTIAGASIDIRIGTNSAKLLNEIKECSDYRYPEINYTLVQCAPEDAEILNIDVFAARNKIDMPTDLDRVQMWLLQEAAPMQNVATVRYIKINSPLNIELVVHLRIDVQRMILARNFNRYILASECLLMPINTAEAAKHSFLELYANIITLHHIKVIDLIYNIDFMGIDRVISLYKSWMQKIIASGALKENDPITQIIPEWETLLVTFPYRKSYSGDKKLVTNDKNTIIIKSASEQYMDHIDATTNDGNNKISKNDNNGKSTWQEMLISLFPRRWTGVEISRQEYRKFNAALIDAKATPENVLMMLESICSASDSFGDASISRRYWYFSSLYELIHMTGVKSCMDKKFNTDIAKTLVQLSVQYAGERDRHLITISSNNNSLSRAPTDIPSMELEDTIISHVFWELLHK